MWTEAEWRARLPALVGAETDVTVENSTFCQKVTWKGRPDKSQNGGGA
jgi:hypothetical protein